MDRRLCDVAVPESLLVRLRKIPTRTLSPKRHAQLGPALAAAALLLCLGLSYTGAIVAFVLAAYENTRPTALAKVHFELEAALVTEPFAAKDLATLTAQVHAEQADPSEASTGENHTPLYNQAAMCDAVYDAVPQHQSHPGMITQESTDQPANRQRFLGVLLPEPLLADLGGKDPQPPWPVFPRGGSVVGQDLSSLIQWAGLGIWQLRLPGPPWRALQEVPEFILAPPDPQRPSAELKKVNWPLPRGIGRRKTKGYDDLFLIGNKTQPVVYLASGGVELHRVAIPLSTDQTSVEVCRRRLAAGQWPDQADVRVEDFLAAAHVLTSAGGQTVRLTARTGVAPLGPHLPWQMAMPSHLLNLVVQAPEAAPSFRPACRLTVLVDCSRSVDTGDHLARVQLALKDLVAAMGPGDLLSLIAFDAEAEVIFEDGRADQAENLCEGIDSLSVGEATNLSAGLQMAYAVAQSHWPRDGRRHRVAMLTDSTMPVSRVIRNHLAQALRQTASEGLSLTVFDLGGTEHGLPRKGPGTLLWDLADAGGGWVESAAGTEQLRWGLKRLLTGCSQVIAHDARLEVQFSPETVLTYRLLGHEPSDPSLDGGPLDLDLRAGESCTGLLEIQLKPGQQGRVAVAQLRWLDPISGQQKSSKVEVTTDQFPSDWSDTQPAVQHLALAAYVAEVLRRSPYFQAKPPGVVSQLAESVARQTQGAPQRRHAGLASIFEVLRLAEALQPRLGQPSQDHRRQQNRFRRGRPNRNRSLENQRSFRPK